MSSRSFYRGFGYIAVSLATLLSTGCNPLAVIYFLFLLPPPKIPAAYDGLEEQAVVVLPYASRDAQFEYAAIDSDVARGVVRHLRDNVDEIKLADPNDVRKWLDEHSGYELVQVGREFKATRVVNIEIQSFSLYEENSSDLYRGRAKVHVQVADVEKDGEIVWETYVETTFPGHRPIAVSEVSREKFRLLFLAHLNRQIAHCFFAYRPDEDFSLN